MADNLRLKVKLTKSQSLNTNEWFKRLPPIMATCIRKNEMAESNHFLWPKNEFVNLISELICGRLGSCKQLGGLVPVLRHAKLLMDASR